MPVFLSPVGGAGAQFFDNNGVPLSGGKLYTYEAGSSTPKTTYTSSTGLTPHTNPIILDSAGRIQEDNEVWLSGDSAYKFILKTSVDYTLSSWDNLWGVGTAGGSEVKSPTIYNSAGTGSTTEYSLLSSPTNENTTSVYINGVYQQKNTYSISGTTLIFSEAPPFTSSIEVIYV